MGAAMARWELKLVAPPEAVAAAAARYVPPSPPDHASHPQYAPPHVPPGPQSLSCRIPSCMNSSCTFTSCCSCFLNGVLTTFGSYNDKPPVVASARAFSTPSCKAFVKSSLIACRSFTDSFGNADKSSVPCARFFARRNRDQGCWA